MANQDNVTGVHIYKINFFMCPLILISQKSLNGEKMAHSNKTAAVA